MHTTDAGSLWLVGWIPPCAQKFNPAEAVSSRERHGPIHAPEVNVQTRTRGTHRTMASLDPLTP